MRQVIWDIKKRHRISKIYTIFHLFLSLRCMTLSNLKAWIGSMESSSIQSFLHPLAKVISIAIMIPTNSAWRTKEIPKLEEKSPIKAAYSPWKCLHIQLDQGTLSSPIGVAFHPMTGCRFPSNLKVFRSRLFIMYRDPKSLQNLEFFHVRKHRTRTVFPN